MTDYELIDELCAITSRQADIIRRLSGVIAQHGIEIEDPLTQRLIEAAENGLDRAEMGLRRR